MKIPKRQKSLKNMVQRKKSGKNLMSVLLKYSGNVILEIVKVK